MSFLVSVIIPVFNASAFVRRAVESAHSLEEVGEVILVEDGSSDASLQTCIALQEEYEKVMLLQHPGGVNLGPAASRNLGIKAAKNNLIAFLDADDKYLPNRFKAEKKILELDKTVDGVYGCMQNVFVSTRAKELFGRGEDSEMDGMRLAVAPEQLFNVLLYGGSGRVSLQVITVKKKALFDAALFNEQLRWNEDTELWLKLALIAKLVAGDLERPGCQRLVHENNLSHQKENERIHRRMMYEGLIFWGIEEGLSFSRLNALFNALLNVIQGKKYSPEKLLFFLVAKKPGIFFHSFPWKKMHLLLTGNKKLLNHKTYRGQSFQSA